MLEALRATYMPELPPIDSGAYLVGYLMRFGPTRSNGMGASALYPDQVAACAEAVGIGRLEPWEVDVICQMSAAFSGESHKATKQGAKAPWLAPGEKPEPTANQLIGRASAAEAAETKAKRKK